jgi:colicin import membrane protein
VSGQRKTVFKWVTGTHLTVLALLLIVPWLKGCFHKKPKIIATFDLSAPPPPPEIVPEVPKPKPQPPKKPEPEKRIAPPATNTPPKQVVKKEPDKPKTEPKKTPPKTEIKKTEITKTDTKKTDPKKEEPKTPPKLTEEQRLAAIRQNKKATYPNKTPAKPALDFSGLQSALSSAASGTGSGSGSGAYSQFAGYYAQVQQKMYQAWQQPSGSPKGLRATATIRVETDGRISSKSITRRSGNFPFDQSVQNALNDTSSLPPPPKDLPSRTIEIEFELAD